MVGRKDPKYEHDESGKMKGIYEVEQGIKNGKTGIWQSRCEYTFKYPFLCSSDFQNSANATHNLKWKSQQICVGRDPDME